MVFHPEPALSASASARGELVARNRRLPDFKRITGYLLWEQDFPRTASMKIKRNLLAEQIRNKVDRSTAVNPL